MKWTEWVDFGLGALTKLKSLKILKKAKIKPWKSNGQTLSDSVKTPGSGRAGSYEENSPDQADYKGLMVTLPLPEGEEEKK